MRCPYCHHTETKVIDKRDLEGGAVTRRRRECEKCHKRFTTYEKTEDSNILVIKNDGRREMFDREKILKGIIKSCEKRPITREEIEKMVDKIEVDIRSSGEKEIKSSKIGRYVMTQLRKKDKVAYIRFASVYKRFEDIEEFKKALDRL